MLGKRTTLAAGLLSVLLTGASGCGDDGLPGGARALEQGRTTWIRGRITDVDGAPLAGLEVNADGASARTDAKGRFELAARPNRELRVAVNSELYSSTALAVSASEEAGAQVELAVKPRRTLKVLDAAGGGRIASDDGFALELPQGALVDAAGAMVRGEVEVRYATVNRPREVVAAPGRMQAQDRAGLEGFGMAEVSFYQAGRRVMLAKEMQVEMPLYEGHGLADGVEVDLYAMTEADVRWTQGARGQVRGNRVVLRASRDQWVGAAKTLPAPSCVKGRLGLSGSRAVANTTVRAARERGLALIQAETHADGSFCMPVTADDDWRVSTFYDDGSESFGLEVNLSSDQAAGMCGGSSGCKDVGDVTLPSID